MYERFTGELETGVTLKVQENDTAVEEGYLDMLIAAFNEAYADQGISAVNANKDSYADLAQDGPYGYGPDVLYQAHDIIMKFADGKHVMPLPITQMEGWEDIPQSAYDAYRMDMGGVTYYMGVPLNMQCPLLFYRQDLIPEDWETNWDADANGVPDMLETWNAMYAYSLSIRDEAAGTYGFMKSLDDAYFNVGYFFSYGGYIFGNNNTDPTDIGLAAADAQKGAWVVRQLASAMNRSSIDDSITNNSPSMLAKGSYFATTHTPDMYESYIRQMVLAGFTDAEAREKLVMGPLPRLPVSGDLSEEITDVEAQTTVNQVMGGVNGYAIGSYTRAPNAALAFVEFATSYEQVMLRNEVLGIIPARKSAADAIGGVSELVFGMLEEGQTVLMPSIGEVGLIWTPLKTLLADLAEDAFRTDADAKYTTPETRQAALEKAAQNIHDAIFTLR